MQEMIRMSDSVLYGMAHFPFSKIPARGSSQIYKRRSFTGIFSRLGPFPQVFRHAKEWLILERNEMIRVSHVVLCPFLFTLFYDRDGQGGVFKVMNNDLF